MSTFDFEARYTHPDYEGIALRAWKYHTTFDEDYEWTGIPTVDFTQVECFMVGDDRILVLEVDDLTQIDDYCPECGQIGCKAYG